MTDLKKQKEKTEGKGWGVVDFSRESPYKFLSEYAKEKKEQIKTKVTNVVKGIKATPDIIKKSLKKKD